MKKARVILPIIAIFVLFSGCSAGKDPYALANDVKTHYNEMSEPSLTARVTADYGDRLSEFTLALAGNEITILAPDEVSGIKARIAVGGVSLVYSDAEVFSGAVTANGLSPVAALPFMLECFRAGTVSSAWLDGDKLTVDYFISDTISLRAEFDAETLSPMAALLTEEGSRALCAEFIN
ncbi:MAG: hypothetical protein IJP43_05725 [Oscillospiraceae bacterium]|nr:hypothetical protein [Oscillospiraceae bacterium]